MQAVQKLALWLLIVCPSVWAGTLPLNYQISVERYQSTSYPRPIPVTAAIEVSGEEAPRGTITVVGGGTSCQITLPATICFLLPVNDQPMEITASYSGDGYYAATAAGPIMHHVRSGEPQIVSLLPGQGQSYEYRLLRSDRPDISGDGRQVVFDMDAFRRFDTQTYQTFGQGGCCASGIAVSSDGQYRALRSGVQLYAGPIDQSLTLISATPLGHPASGLSSNPRLNGDGQIVVFQSDAPDLLYGDSNATSDIFVWTFDDLSVSRLSEAMGGLQANGPSIDADISEDGRYVTFTSEASNLVPGDSNGVSDIFLVDRQSGQVQRISESRTGAQATGASNAAAISGDGQFVAFESDASNLVTNDSNGKSDVFVKHWPTGQIYRASQTSSGVQGGSHSRGPAISHDGRFVAFRSASANLIPGDTNGKWDTLVWDRLSRQLERVSVSNTGQQISKNVETNAISSDGRYVVFDTPAAELDSRDNNLNTDVFIRDRYLQSTRPASAYWGLGQPSDSAWQVDASGDGSIVLFYTSSDNFPGAMVDRSHLVWRNRHTDAFGLANRRLDGQPTTHLYGAKISADGRYAAFSSMDSGLVNDDTNGREDVFLHNLVTGVTSRLNRNEDGSQTTHSARLIDMSSTGRYVAYQQNRIDGFDIVRLDRSTQTMEIANVLDNGQVLELVDKAVMSADGRYIAFDHEEDIYVHDFTLDFTVKAVDIWHSFFVYDLAISGNGRFIAIHTDDNTLVPGDLNTTTDIVIHDRQLGTNVFANLDNNGQQMEPVYGPLMLSNNGSIVMFSSTVDDHQQVFSRHMVDERTTLISKNSADEPLNGQTGTAWLSGDGHQLILASTANNFVADADTGYWRQYFLRNEGANNGPVTMDDQYQVLEDNSLQAHDIDGSQTPSALDNGLLANDTDTEGDGFSLTAPLGTSTSNGLPGTVLLTSAGALTFTPEDDAFGVATLDYEATDALGITSSGYALIDVLPVNDAPEFDAGTPIALTTPDAWEQQWATDIGPGADNESDQTVQFSATMIANSGLQFIAAPDIASDGILSFELAPSSTVNARAVFEVTLMDDGGTDHGGMDTSATATLSITLGDHLFSDGFGSPGR